MVTRTFIERSNTIFKDSEENFGLNPIGMLNYGEEISRCLLWFDTSKMKEEGKHFLKLTNCGSINDDLSAERACSFELIVFKVLQEWDAGKGFDKSTDFWLTGRESVSTEGSNWYYARNGKTWNKIDESGNTMINESGETVPEEGIYSIDFLEKEYKKYKQGENSIIIGSQSFDAGNENVNIDITPYINEILLEEEPNYGLCIAFAPYLEGLKTSKTHYFDFFTNNTNTFFLPFVESKYDNLVIDDNRYSFYIGKPNKLYFFADFGGVPEDLDNLPICKVKGVECTVKRQNKGVYYAEVKLSKEDASDNEIIYDTWSNLVYQGEELEEVELEFVAHKKENYFQLGEKVNKVSNMIPSLCGINDNEKIYQGDERTVKVMFKIPYTNDYELLNDCQYRLYVKDGKREIDVIDWDDIDTIGKENSFQIRSRELIPNEYYIDIKAKIGNDIRIFKNKLNFIIVDNVTEIKK